MKVICDEAWQTPNMIRFLQRKLYCEAKEVLTVRRAPALPTRGNSRSPSPSFCSPVIGPLNLSSAASRTRFIPKPCAGRWNVPGFGSRAGARNCSVGSRSCMGCLSRQREHSGNGQGRTRAPPAQTAAAAGMTSTSPLAVCTCVGPRAGITTVHPIGARESSKPRLRRIPPRLHLAGRANLLRLRPRFCVRWGACKMLDER